VEFGDSLSVEAQRGVNEALHRARALLETSGSAKR
jgi:hypothetical protein